MDLQDKIMGLTKRLVGVVSETDTVEERGMAQAYYDVLAEMAYFKENPKFYGKYLVANDNLMRSVVWGLVRGVGSETVILINHLDTVDTRDYLDLRSLAENPEELVKGLAQRELDSAVMTDLESGNWLFGRGTADMKGGASIQLALIEQYGLEENFQGNVLYLSVPDEETLSAGMRAAVDLLDQLQEEYTLEYKLLIDVETHVRLDFEKPVLYKGSIGKLMPAVLVKGVRAHIGNVFQGFNPLAVMAETVNLVELNQSFSDNYQGELAPPPTWMYLRDNKKTYDVSIPHTAFGYTSVLTYSSTPQAVLDHMKQLVREAFEICLKRYQSSYLRYYGENPKNDWSAEIYTLAELFEKLKTEKGDAFLVQWEAQLAEVTKAISTDEYDMTVGTNVLMEFLLKKLPNNRPSAVIGLAPPYYPHVINDKMKQADDKIHHLGDDLKVLYQQEYGDTLVTCNFYNAISDMSYASLQDAEEVIPSLIKNMPLWGDAYKIPLEKIANLQIPSINLGPWGKDLHMFTERIYLPDLLEHTPWLMNQAIRLILKK